MNLQNITLGIIGGGQLGRMSAMAAARLGIKTHIYCPEDNSPASQVAAKTFVGAYDDKMTLQDFAHSVDYITYEFENIPVDTVHFLKNFKPVYPDENLLEIAQDRIIEKQYLNDIGIPTAKWIAIKEQPDLLKLNQGEFLEGIIFKTTRLGYDGKGQVSCRPKENPIEVANTLNTDIMIAEQYIDFIHEISVIVARDIHGKSITYGPMINTHKNHMLDKTTCVLASSSSLSGKLREQAEDAALKVAKETDLVGVLAVEMFVVHDDQGRETILANEIAPRPHNSGHWSIDACAVSQFENHVRAVCGLPVEEPDQHSHAEMINLIGHDVDDMESWLRTDNTCVHLYGKEEVKDGRKMGHVTILK